jgi:hypothetical protein
MLLACRLYGDSQPQISYTALSNAAKESGQLSLYKDVPLYKAQIKLAENVLVVNTPRHARAYDVIPIPISLKQTAGSSRIAIEAVAFEDHQKAGDKPLYDLSIPGNMNIKIEYIGSICADYQQERYIPLTPDPNTPISPFPPFKRDKFICSSTIRPADVVWFKFRITNTGNTIFDPEGFAGSFAEPYLYKFDPNGREIWQAKPVNLFVRQLNYIYPGESIEQWVNFQCPEGSSGGLGLAEGNYRIDYRMVCRFYDKYNWEANIWNGTEFARLEVPITVKAKPGVTPISSSFKMSGPANKMPGYFAAFEEFMTSFKIYPPQPKTANLKDVLYLQVAPWTTHIVVKIISDNPSRISVKKIPIKIDDETLAVKYNPKNMMTVNANNREEPAFISMPLDAMRIGFQLGPFPEEHMYELLKEQKYLGVNVIANTAGGWWIPEIKGCKEIELTSASYKYFYDVLMRKLNMKVLGCSLYPPSGTQWYTNAAPLFGKELSYMTVANAYSAGPPALGVDMTDPIVPEVIAAWVKYQYQRWGDTWFKTKDGRVPVDMEDTWGWLRDDINTRFTISLNGIEMFRKWVQKKYGNIEQVNILWHSDFKDFNDINPEANQGVEYGWPSYNKKELVFHEWTPAVEDWDIFRTEFRLSMIAKTNAAIRRFLPTGEISPRTEGANLLIKGCADNNNMHWRHVYYSQRRNAMVQDVIKTKDVIHFYSDYTTLPYTENEWRQAMRKMVADGIVPMCLPQFDHMRDILLNPYYGREYQMHYNLDKPSKGIMIHCLMAAYPWWKATYEEGGAPGILWSDYLCDGFATETQKRELKLLHKHFENMVKNR